jgi:hypothetical protein
MMERTSEFLLGLREKAKSVDLKGRSIVGVKWEKAKCGTMLGFESPIILLDDGSWLDFYADDFTGIVFEVRPPPHPKWAAER